MKARHKQSRDPRGHWLTLLLVLPAVFAVLLFEGWTDHEVDAAKSRSPCTEPAPDAVAYGDGPVVGINRGGIQTASMPARTVALTFDGGPDPVWPPACSTCCAATGRAPPSSSSAPRPPGTRSWYGGSAPRATRSAPTPTPAPSSVRLPRPASPANST